MDEMTAWNIFTSTGKVEDYIRFRSVAREDLQKSVTGKGVPADSHMAEDAKCDSAGTGVGNYQVI